MASQMEWIDMANVPRRLAFPLPVQTLGHIIVESEHYCGIHAGKLEFCFRLRSDDAMARDRIDGREYELHFPHLLVKQPRLLHEYEFSRQREAIFIIYPDSLLPVFESFGVSFADPALEFRYDEHGKALFADLINLFKIAHLPGIADEVDAKAWLVIQHVYALASQDIDNPDTALGAVRQIGGYISTHYAKPIDMDQLVRRYGFSLRSFYRHWAKVFTQSPKDMIMDLKMKEALRLLENQVLPVSRIAGMLNFSDSAYFILHFRKRFGITPLQYRRKLNRSRKPLDSKF